MAVERAAAQGVAGSLNGLRYAVKEWLHALGRDDAGTARTPDRVARAWAEMTSGYAVDVEALLATRFASGNDQLVLVRDCPVVSLCEHHVMPFTGTAVVGYIPNGTVLGLSKIPRLVDAFARRLQIQETLTEQIADALWRTLDPLGVGVVVEASHTCTACRGARAPATLVTSALRGALRADASARAEFLALAHAR